VKFKILFDFAAALYMLYRSYLVSYARQSKLACL